MTSAKPLACGFNMPAALVGKHRHGLPPYAPRKAFIVDEYPTCPDDWMRSAGRTSSYFVPVQEGKGMWLDFNSSLEHTPQHVAIVVSVQGINAITGLPCNDAQLEQYVERCPRHKAEFGPGRFCKDCNYRWPKQNYIASTGTPHGQLWIDGFRAADGAVRQYILTTETMRGVANAIIGKKRVFAIGISCFLSKTPRPVHHVQVIRSFGSFITNETPIGYDNTEPTYSKSTYNGLYDPANSPMCSSNAGESLMSHVPDQCNKNNRLYSESVEKISAKRTLNAFVATRPTVVQALEIAAGEEIRQEVYDDPHDLDFWKPKPESILVINYALEADVEKILAGGKISLAGDPKGFMQGVPVGAK